MGYELEVGEPLFDAIYSYFCDSGLAVRFNVITRNEPVTGHYDSLSIAFLMPLKSTVIIEKYQASVLDL